MRTIKISALTLALMAATPSEVDALIRKTVETQKRPKKESAPSSESVSESILYVLMFPIFLAKHVGELQARAALLR